MGGGAGRGRGGPGTSGTRVPVAACLALPALPALPALTALPAWGLPVAPGGSRQLSSFRVLSVVMPEVPVAGPMGAERLSLRMSEKARV